MLLYHISSILIFIYYNTSGARKEAVFCTQLAREALETNWLKLKFIPIKIPNAGCNRNAKATEALAKLGFIVLPYIHADPVLCKHLEEAEQQQLCPRFANRK
jgi:thiazole synthase